MKKLYCFVWLLLLCINTMQAMQKKKDRKQKARSLPEMFSAAPINIGNTALHDAVHSQELVMIKRLLVLGVNPNVLNMSGNTPLNFISIPMDCTYFSTQEQKITEIIAVVKELITYKAIVEHNKEVCGEQARRLSAKQSKILTNHQNNNFIVSDTLYDRITHIHSKFNRIDPTHTSKGFSILEQLKKVLEDGIKKQVKEKY